MFSKYGQVWIILATIGDHVNSEIQTTIDEYEMNGIIASVFIGSVWHKPLFYRVLLELDLEEKISPFKLSIFKTVGQNEDISSSERSSYFQRARRVKFIFYNISLRSFHFFTIATVHL